MKNYQSDILSFQKKCQFYVFGSAFITIHHAMHCNKIIRRHVNIHDTHISQSDNHTTSTK